MNKETIIIIAVVALVLLAVLFATGIVKINLGGKAVAVDSSGKLDTTGWTENEKMNYEMHGTIPARLQGKASAPSTSAGSGMVGGC